MVFVTLCTSFERSTYVLEALHVDLVTCFPHRVLPPRYQNISETFWAFLMITFYVFGSNKHSVMSIIYG